LTFHTRSGLVIQNPLRKEMLGTGAYDVKKNRVRTWTGGVGSGSNAIEVQKKQLVNP